MIKKPIFVTQPDLPNLDDFQKSLQEIWDNKWLTNNGKFHQELEQKLAIYLGVEHLSLFVNGTLALITALQVLGISGEVITTPYSFVATTHALWWNKIKPIFVDIDPNTNNLDPEKIEAAITSETTAILPVHVYGVPCDVKSIQEIADKHGLKVIYDAAHAFGVETDQNSILNFGDLSILSFHATKSFNTIEGGAIVCHSAKTKEKIDSLKNFGFKDEVTIVAPGINAKMNELQAAFGLLQLNSIDQQIAKRKTIATYYKKKLLNIKGIQFSDKDDEGTKNNYSYFPIMVDGDFPMTRDDLYFELQKKNIYGRRYFYPLISKFSPYNKLPSAISENLPVAERVSNQVICLPIYPDLKLDEIDFITQVIKNCSIKK